MIARVKSLTSWFYVIVDRGRDNCFKFEVLDFFYVYAKIVDGADVLIYVVFLPS